MSTIGHPVLELVNADDPVAWVAGRDGATPAHPEAVRRLREAVRAILLGDPADAAAGRAGLQRLWSAAVGRAVLVPAADGPGAVGVQPGPEPAWRVPDQLTLAAVDLLREVDLTRLKQCPVAEGGCGYLFLDRSRNGSRRWCSMRDCGSQVKADRLTARRRAARAGGR